MHEVRYAKGKLLLASLSACLVSRLLKCSIMAKNIYVCILKTAEDSSPLRNM